jgi:hypothetical protein
LLKAGLDFGGQRHREVVIEGEIDPVQKLQRLIACYEEQGALGDLNESIAAGSLGSSPVMCFAYKGLFTCLNHQDTEDFFGANAEYRQMEQKETSYSPVLYGLSTTGCMCVLKSECHNHHIYLACSMKYFSDMGSSRRETPGGQDVFDIHPHSGNWMFFSGKHSASFEAVLFLTGQSGSDLYGSPLALINAFSPDLAL